MSSPISYPGGIYWEAVLIGTFDVVFTPSFTQLGGNNQLAFFNIELTPTLTFQPPVPYGIIFGPTFIFQGHAVPSAFGEFRLTFEPNFGMRGFTNNDVGIQFTPQFKFAGVAKLPARIYFRAAVQRASTI